MKMNLKNYFYLLVLIVSIEVGGILSSLSVSSNSNWYSGLIKPTFTPPNWIFGLVWTILYALMGVAMFLVLKAGIKNKRVKTSLILFTAQLLLNFLWSPLFFYFEEMGLALLEILILLIVVCFTIISFRGVSKLAFWLMIPYAMWLIIATYLNYSFWILNA